MNRWKVLACTLTVGVGGLAVFAMPQPASWDLPKETPPPPPKLTTKPETPANGSDTPAPIKPVKGEVFDLDLPAIALPPKSPDATPPLPAVKLPEPVIEFPSPVLIPATGAEPPKPPAKVETPLIPVIPKPETKAPPPPPAFETPKPPPDTPATSPPSNLAPPAIELTPPRAREAPKPPVVAVPPSPKPAVDLGAPSTLPPEPLSPMPLIKETKAPTNKLKLLLRMGDGQPRFEIRNTASTELLLKVYGERIDMQSPPEQKSSSLAGVSATGNVKFTAPGIEGHCDHLTILSGTGEVLLKGNIRLKSKTGKGWSEMTAEKMVYQIGASGLATGSKPPVTPAAYIPD